MSRIDGQIIKTMTALNRPFRQFLSRNIGIAGINQGASIFLRYQLSHNMEPDIPVFLPVPYPESHVLNAPIGKQIVNYLTACAALLRMQGLFQCIIRTSNDIHPTHLLDKILIRRYTMQVPRFLPIDSNSRRNMIDGLGQTNILPMQSANFQALAILNGHILETAHQPDNTSIFIQRPFTRNNITIFPLPHTLPMDIFRRLPRCQHLELIILIRIRIRMPAHILIGPAQNRLHRGKAVIIQERLIRSQKPPLRILPEHGRCRRIQYFRQQIFRSGQPASDTVLTGPHIHPHIRNISDCAAIGRRLWLTSIRHRMDPSVRPLQTAIANSRLG